MNLNIYLVEPNSSNIPLHQQLQLSSWETQFYSLMMMSATEPPDDEPADFDLRDTDVISGKDKFAQSYIGNLRFRDLVKTYREEYGRHERRVEKTRIIHEIIEIIASRDGRFLKRDEATGQWTELNASARHEKVSNSIKKSYLRVKQKAKKCQERKRKAMQQQKQQAESNTFARLYEMQQAIFRDLLAQDEARREDAAMQTEDDDDDLSFCSFTAFLNLCE
jgi:hypothetical protein